MKLQVNERAIKDAVHMLQHAIDKNYPGGFSIVFNTIRPLLDEKHIYQIVKDLASICSRHTSMLPILEQVLKDVGTGGFQIQREELQKIGVKNVKVLKILLDNGLVFTADDIKASIKWCRISVAALKMLCKLCPEAQREIAQPLIDEYFCDRDCIQSKGELACEILDPNEAAVLMGASLAKAFTQIEKQFNNDVAFYKRTYSGTKLHDGIERCRVHTQEKKADLANRLHRLVNRIPNWKKCRDEIIQNTTDRQVAELLAHEMEGTT